MRNFAKEGTYYDYFTNEKYESGTHEFACLLDEFPLLVKGGVPVPLQPYTKRMASEKLKELHVVNGVECRVAFDGNCNVIKIKNQNIKDKIVVILE